MRLFSSGKLIDWLGNPKEGQTFFDVTMPNTKSSHSNYSSNFVKLFEVSMETSNVSL